MLKVVASPLRHSSAVERHALHDTRISRRRNRHLYPSHDPQQQQQTNQTKNHHHWVFGGSGWKKEEAQAVAALPVTPYQPFSNSSIVYKNASSSVPQEISVPTSSAKVVLKATTTSSSPPTSSTSSTTTIPSAQQTPSGDATTDATTATARVTPVLVTSNSSSNKRPVVPKKQPKKKTTGKGKTVAKSKSGKTTAKTKRTNSKKAVEQVVQVVKHSELRPHDILMGRGGKTNGWQGNVRFRQIVEAFKPQYRVAERYERKKVAALIHEKVVAGGGARFLEEIKQPDENEQESDDTSIMVVDKVYAVVSTKRAIEKVSHTCRERGLLSTSSSSSAASLAPPPPPLRRPSSTNVMSTSLSAKAMAAAERLAQKVVKKSSLRKQKTKKAPRRRVSAAQNMIEEIKAALDGGARPVPVKKKRVLFKQHDCNSLYDDGDEIMEEEEEGQTTKTTTEHLLPQHAMKHSALFPDIVMDEEEVEEKEEKEHVVVDEQPILAPTDADVAIESKADQQPSVYDENAAHLLLSLSLPPGIIPKSHLHARDVVIGGSRNHQKVCGLPHNGRFWKIVDNYQPTDNLSSKKSRCEAARALVQKITCQGGRFVEKCNITPSLFNSNSSNGSRTSIKNGSSSGAPTADETFYKPLSKSRAMEKVFRVLEDRHPTMSLEV